MSTHRTGEIYRVSGPVVTATGIAPKMYDVAMVGEEGLMGEVIGIHHDRSVIQVYEDTSGLRPGEKVLDTGAPLVAELGPGLLGSIYDGVQRPLPVLAASTGDFIRRGLKAPGLDRKRAWGFEPLVKAGAKLTGGDALGTVQETETIKHKVLLPPGLAGELKDLRAGSFQVEDVIGHLADGTELRLMHRWPVRVPRPFKEKLMPDIPLLTGQRILDGMFPLAKGGTAAIPGPFGSGKTVMQHQLAKWSDSQVVTYIGCGERGNEMTEVLREFPELIDPTTGKPLMARTVLIANTSNMPVAAREASVYTGITIAEYYRDMGYSVSLMADSTSRWAEAMREISSRLEEMPGEEGYPAYLAAKLADFYERAGRVRTLGGGEGSVTVVGAVSPPGGDFSEPVTQNTLRIVKVFWALDAKLANRRHFPAINWLTSYSLYGGTLDPWFAEHVAPDFTALRGWIMNLLQREDELQEIVQLVGSDTLPDDQQLVLEVARLVREFFLQQNAYHDVDTFCALDKQYKMMQAIRRFHDLGAKAIKEGAGIRDVAALKSKDELTKTKFEERFDEELAKVHAMMEDEFKALGGGAR
jgi:V/A-type H+-transporting ATPase subunit A